MFLEEAFVIRCIAAVRENSGRGAALLLLLLLVDCLHQIEKRGRGGRRGRGGLLLDSELLCFLLLPAFYFVVVWVGAAFLLGFFDEIKNAFDCTAFEE